MNEYLREGYYNSYNLQPYNQKERTCLYFKSILDSLIAPNEKKKANEIFESKKPIFVYDFIYVLEPRDIKPTKNEKEAGSLISVDSWLDEEDEVEKSTYRSNFLKLISGNKVLKDLDLLSEDYVVNKHYIGCNCYNSNGCECDEIDKYRVNFFNKRLETDEEFEIRKAYLKQQEEAKEKEELQKLEKEKKEYLKLKERFEKDLD